MSMNNLLIEAQNQVTALTAERDQLANELEEVKALFVDAIGDGFYDGCFACVKDNKENPWHVDQLTEDDILKMSEQYESKHRYAKSIADIRAQAGKNGFIAGVLLVNPTAKGRESLNDEANKYADSIRQAAKDGE